MDSDRVLSEMKSTGLGATELGPDGFLPTDPDELVDYVKGFDLQVVGGFVPAVLYRDRGIDEQLAYVDRANSQLAKTGSEFIILGPDSHFDGYDTEIEMSQDEWDTFIANLNKVMNNAEDHGLSTAIHPHWGMAIASEAHVERMLGCCEVGLCLDTGHLFLAGCDPLDIAKLAGDRVNHVHLKDVNDTMAERVRSGQLPFRQAVIDGMFQPLGAGSVDIGGLIRHLEANGYQGWYVLEQDCALAEDPAPGDGPVADAMSSVAYLERLAAEL
ncbi:MAG: TIM barrel protein [Actinomycetia bacterium]|nr:TIM barrel protein [Actinomycetes bacterium]